MSTQKYKLLFVDDEAGWCVKPIAELEDNGFEVLYEGQAEKTLKKIASFAPHAVILDILFSNENKGKPTFKKVKDKYPSLPVIMLTSTMKDTFSMKDYTGCAFAFAKDQFDAGTDNVYIDFAEKIIRAIENSYTKESLKKGFDFIVGETDEMEKVCRDILKVAPTDASVLITGESGTGKELIAKAICNKSNRQDKPFIAVNCGAIAENLLESQFFGYVKGAFTDAKEDKKGLFEEANEGTFFLDEIGELPLQLQVKFLRVLQEGEVRRLGGSKDIKIDVRIIAATVKDLANEAEEGKFRIDLYHRLNKFVIHLFPLRDRREDIPELLTFFIHKFNKVLKKSIMEDCLRDDVLQSLKEYDWPGNIREFENSVERAMIYAGDYNVLLPEHFIGIRKDKKTNEIYNIEKVIDEVFDGKWKSSDKWNEFIKIYTRQGPLKEILLRCIERLKDNKKSNIRHQDVADLFGIKENNMRKWITAELEIDWQEVKKR